MLELTVAFGSNLSANSTLQSEKHKPLIHTIQSTYTKVKFIDVAMSALGALGYSCDSLFSMVNDLGTP